eukprot:10186469-Karenia_brevis.AAC.1
MARALHPVVVKSCLSVTPPLQWKGGQIFELYKGQGQQSECTSYRDITLCDSMAKSLGKPVRAAAFE